MAQPHEPGAVLAGRFELHGVVGRGGTAEVWLATDRLRGERVALKIVHSHLAADPDTRRRLQREVGTAGLVRSAAALVPYDLHEIDGQLALSMPFHPGQTLAERVATVGKLDPEDVRRLGIRLSAALADAHRAGVLHRDVTANNVLVGDDIDASVLTDFGLSRVLGGTRSTGLLGTAGYAAPEVYAGERADPRSDLYGLGGVLYLALTGRPAFDPRDPMTALKRQLDESQPKVRDLVPSAPADLAALVDQLLRADPTARPQGAREVLDALIRREGPPVAAPVGVPVTEPAAAAETVRALPQGRYTVIVRERNEDRTRRDRLRRKALGVRASAEDEVVRWGQHLWGRLREAVGVPPTEALTPEESLHAAIVELVGTDRLQASRVVLERKFRLVDATDVDTATHLANRAVTLGYRAEVVELTEDLGWRRVLTIVLMAAMILGWVSVGQLIEVVGPLIAIASMVAVSVGVGQLASRRTTMRERDLRRLPVAYPQTLAGLLPVGVSAGAATVAAPSLVHPAVQRAVQPAARRSRGEELRDRALAAIDGLEQGADQADLADPARADLRTSARQMRARAAELGTDVDRIERALVDLGDEADVAALRTRLGRMEALERSGERVEARERARVQQALAAHEADRDAADRLESDLAAATASLLELASSASRLRRELVLERDAHQSADELVARLSRETRAAMDARREAGIRAAQAVRAKT